MRKLWKWLRSPAMIVFWSYASMAAGNLPAILLLCYADHLGVWWFILLMIYMTALACVFLLILWPREVARLRYTLGDEAFFLLYPWERKRELRRLERRERALEKSRIQHMQRNEPVVSRRRANAH